MKFLGIIQYTITTGGSLSNGEAAVCFVDLLDQEGNFIIRKNRNSTLNGLSGTIEVPNAKLWWPYLMHPNPGYMYTLQVLYFPSFKKIIIMWGNPINGAISDVLELPNVQNVSQVFNER